jgi:hypothetical protein
VELINKCEFVIVQKIRLCFYKVVNEMLAMVVSAIKKFQGGNDSENGKFVLEKRKKQRAALGALRNVGSPGGEECLVT